MTTTNRLDAQSPISARFLAWVNERFPFANALLFFILYLATAAVVRGAANGPISLSWRDAVACLVTWSFFLLLRVFDEHKDYELDCSNHPQRVLQSGLITLKHLKVAGAAALLLQVGWSIYLDQGVGGTCAAWFAMFVWTCLMGKEFFVAEWLTRHLTLYAASHMLVMPLIVWWLANMAMPGLALSVDLKILMSLAFISGFCFEITRKTKGPEEERDTIESYSRIFGTKGSALVVLALITAMVGAQWCLIEKIMGTPPWWAVGILVLAFAMGVRQVLAFIQAPSAKAREKNEAAVAIAMLAGYAVLIAVEIVHRGFLLNAV